MTLSSIRSALIGDEQAAVLVSLLDAHPELVEHADRLALELLNDVDIEHVANAVEEALASISLDDLGARVGRALSGYVNEVDAAWDLVDETIEPFRDDVKRRASVGLAEAAAAVATGVIAGLYRHREPDEADVVAYAGPDAIDSIADEVYTMIDDFALELGEGAGDRYWPEWSMED